MSLKNVSPTKTLAWKALLSHFDSIKGAQIKNLLNNYYNKTNIRIKTRKNGVNFVVIEENFRIGGLFESLTVEMMKINLFKKFNKMVIFAHIDLRNL